MDHVDILIGGAGPHGLTLAAHLRFADPTRSIMVVDPAGCWLGRWRDRFRRFSIDRLRSPSVHHPDPDPFALRSFGPKAERSFLGRYDSPGAEFYDAFCDDLIIRHGLGSAVFADQVESLEPQSDCTTVVLGSGSQVEARAVVMATADQLRNDDLSVPGFAVHADEVDLDDPPDGAHIVVVGGGITAGHLVLGALEHGRRVTHVVRRPLSQREFDTDPGWLGPMHLDRFGAESCARTRRDLAISARDGGTMPGWMLDQLSAAAGHSDRLRCVVGPVSKIELGLTWIDGVGGVESDVVWLATGWRPAIERSIWGMGLLVSHPTPVHDGIPELDRDLRWPGTDIWCSGHVAQLRLGPAAGNLIGARFAAELIVPAIGAKLSTD